MDVGERKGPGYWGTPDPSWGTLTWKLEYSIYGCTSGLDHIVTNTGMTGRLEAMVGLLL